MRRCFMNVDLFDFLIVYAFDQSVFCVIISCFEMSMTMEKQWQNASATTGSSFHLQQLRFYNTIVGKHFFRSLYKTGHTQLEYDQYEGVKCNLSCKNPINNDPKRLMNSSATCSCVPDRIEIWSSQRKPLGATGNESLTLFILLATIARRDGCIH